jgi:hypothetical protein
VERRVYRSACGREGKTEHPLLFVGSDDRFGKVEERAREADCQLEYPLRDRALLSKNQFRVARDSTTRPESRLSLYAVIETKIDEAGLKRISSCLRDGRGSVGNFWRLSVGEAWRLRINAVLAGSSNSGNFCSAGPVGSHPAIPGSAKVIKSALRKVHTSVSVSVSADV